MSDSESIARAHLRIDELVKLTNGEIKEIRDELRTISVTMEGISKGMPKRPCAELMVLQSEFEGLSEKVADHANSHARNDEHWWQVASRVFSWAITGAAGLILAEYFLGKI